MEEKQITMKIRFHDRDLPHRDQGLHLQNAETRDRPPDISDFPQEVESTRALHMGRSIQQHLQQ